MNVILWASVCFLLLLATSPARATVTVREGVNTNPPGVTRQFIMGTNKWRVTIVRSDNLPIILTIEGTANDTIEWIRATNNGAGSADIQLIVGVPGGPGIGTIEEISRIGDADDRPVSIISMWINGNLGRPFSSVDNGVKVNRFQDARVGGHLNGQINMLGTDFGNQPNSLVVEGNVYTHITAIGPIGSIEIKGDMIGLPPPTSPITIWTPLTIESVRVRGMHNATIGHAFSFDSLDSIAFLEVTNSVTTDTPVPGEGTAGVLAQSIGTVKIGGDFGCTLRVEGGLPNDPNLPSIQIGGSLLAAGSIILPTNGLKSQVIIRANVTSGSWQGSVTVGGVPLSPLTLYNNLPSDIGEGAVGVPQFTVHKKASVPDVSAFGAIYEVSENGPIILRHYGPVVDPMTGATPYVITKTPYLGGTSVDVSSCFDQLRNSANHTIMTLTPKSGQKMLRGYKYSVAPRSGVLRCDLPSGMGTPIAAYVPFAYAVCPEAGDAPGDADDSGLVDFADITEVLADFGLPVVCSSLGDADRSGTIDFADVTSVLTNWLAEYCLTLGSSSGGQAGDGFTTMGLDGELSAAEAIGNIADALAQMGYASPEAFSDAISQMTTEARDAEVRRLGSLLQGSN